MATFDEDLREALIANPEVNAIWTFVVPVDNRESWLQDVVNVVNTVLEQHNRKDENGIYGDLTSEINYLRKEISRRFKPDVHKEQTLLKLAELYHWLGDCRPKNSAPNSPVTRNITKKPAGWHGDVDSEINYLIDKKSDG
jgi:hypothetical protein